MKEIWKDIPNYEGYQASNLGRIRSLYTRYGYAYKCIKYEPHIMKGNIANNGYLMIGMKDGNKTAHRLIAKTFIPNPNNYPVINHKDGNKLNNNINNLEWCTYKHNSQEALKNGAYDKIKLMISLNPIRSKRIIQYDIEGNYINEYRDSAVAGKETKICATNIRKVANGERKTAGGYIWRFKNGKRIYNRETN